MSVNRVYKGRAVSLTDELYVRATHRAETLKPRVSSFSNYVQQLIALELERGLLGPLGKRVLLAGQ